MDFFKWEKKNSIVKNNEFTLIYFIFYNMKKINNNKKKYKNRSYLSNQIPVLYKSLSESDEQSAKTKFRYFKSKMEECETKGVKEIVNFQEIANKILKIDDLKVFGIFNKIEQSDWYTKRKCLNQNILNLTWTYLCVQNPDKFADVFKNFIIEKSTIDISEDILQLIDKKIHEVIDQTSSNQKNEIQKEEEKSNDESNEEEEGNDSFNCENLFSETEDTFSSEDPIDNYFMNNQNYFINTNFFPQLD